MVESLDFVASTVAVVFGPEFQPKSPVPGQAMAAFLHRPTVSLSPDGSVVITSHRDQVEVVLSANKLDVRDVSGRDETAYEKIPKVLHGIRPLLSGEQPKLLGINFVVSVPQENPRSWIAQKFLAQDLKTIIQAQFDSNSVSVSYEQSGKRVTVRFDASPESALIVNFNASQDIDDLPAEEEMARDIKSQRKALLELLRALGVESK